MTIARMTPTRWRISLIPLLVTRWKLTAGGGGRPSAPQRDTQPVQRTKKGVRPVGVAGHQPELDAAQAGREPELLGTPAPEIGGHPVKELPPAAPGHQRQERGVVPDRPLENRRADQRGGWG